MAIMTGVQSAQVLRPSTQKQADKSCQSIERLNDSKERATEEPSGKSSGAHSDGGTDEVDSRTT